MTKKGIEPPCVQEFVNPSMVPFVLPTALQIARDTTDTDFVLFILPGIDKKRSVRAFSRLETSVADPCNFGTDPDPDPRIHTSD